MKPRAAWIDNQIGKRFGNITILAQQRVESGRRMALIICDCGIRTVVYPENIRNGLTKTCGNHIGRRRTHGMYKSKEYPIWNQMIRRCTRPKHPEFSNYGARGIKVCERWMKFENFYADMGAKPTGRSLDRFPDNDGNYEPGNCRWATSIEQCNNMRKNVYIEFNGRRQTATEWARETGIKAGTLTYRFRRGYSPASIFSVTLGPMGYRYAKEPA